MRARPDYQLSPDIHSHKAGTKYPDKLPLYIVQLLKKNKIKKSITFYYAQLSWATFIHSESGFGVMYKNTKTNPKMPVLATSENVNESIILQST